jgi:hypothetical protein
VSKRYRSGVQKKVNNQHRYDSANYQEVSTKPQNIPTIVNGYVPVSKDKKMFSFNNSKELYAKLLNSKNILSKSSEYKIPLIGDSHLKGCSENMKIHVNDKFQVCGYIKPGAGVKGILEQPLKDVDNLLAKDVIVLCCGSNDIGKIKLRTFFNGLINFIKRVTHTNVIVLTVPYRHDLKASHSTLNDEIITFNRKLLKLSKLFPHLSVCEINEMRHLYTNHGLHMNYLGKELLSLNLVLHIFSLIEKINNHSTNIIALGVHKVHPQTISPIKQLPPLISVKTVENMSVKRNRKKPVTKTNDFLWEI